MERRKGKLNRLLPRLCLKLKEGISLEGNGGRQAYENFLYAFHYAPRLYVLHIMWIMKKKKEFLLSTS